MLIMDHSQNVLALPTNIPYWIVTFSHH